MRGKTRKLVPVVNVTVFPDKIRALKEKEASKIRNHFFFLFFSPKMSAILAMMRLLDILESGTHLKVKTRVKPNSKY